MSKFQIYRADMDKIVCKEIEAETADAAISKYGSALMAAGMIAMRDSAIKFVSGTEATISTVAGKQFNVTARAI